MFGLHFASAALTCTLTLGTAALPTVQEAIGTARKRDGLRNLTMHWITALQNHARFRLLTRVDDRDPVGIATFAVEGLAPADLVSALWTQRRILVASLVTSTVQGHARFGQRLHDAAQSRHLHRCRARDHGRLRATKRAVVVFAGRHNLGTVSLSLTRADAAAVCVHIRENHGVWHRVQVVKAEAARVAERAWRPRRHRGD
jgi:selenocysteine lyase/cysteine desulfurase